MAMDATAQRCALGRSRGSTGVQLRPACSGSSCSRRGSRQRQLVLVARSCPRRASALILASAAGAAQGPAASCSQRTLSPVRGAALDSLIRDGYAVLPWRRGRGGQGTQEGSASIEETVSAALGAACALSPVDCGTWACADLPCEVRDGEHARASTTELNPGGGLAASSTAALADEKRDPAALLATQLLTTRASQHWQMASCCSAPGQRPSAGEALLCASCVTVMHLQVPNELQQGSTRTSLRVFPRSHWAVADWLQTCLDSSAPGAEGGAELPWTKGVGGKEGSRSPPGEQQPALSGNPETSSGPLLEQRLPGPMELPHASPEEVILHSDELLLLHPWSLLSADPLPGSLGPVRGQWEASIELSITDKETNSRGNSTGGLLSHRLDFACEGGSTARVDLALPALEMMWLGWPVPGNGLPSKGGPQQHPPVVLNQDELRQLQEEAERADKGNWAVPTAGATLRGLSSLLLQEHGQRPLKDVLGATVCTRLDHIWAKDLVSWSLRTVIQRHLQAGQWKEANALLLKAAPLAPRDPVVAFLTGFCLIQTVPAGQTAGRAGRKCWLEDAERYLCRASELDPSWVLPSCVLVRALLLMGRGREVEAAPVMAAVVDECVAFCTVRGISLPSEAEPANSSTQVAMSSILPCLALAAGWPQPVEELLTEALAASKTAERPVCTKT